MGKKTSLKVRFSVVKSRFLLYKNDFKFQLGFKVVVKKGTNKILFAPAVGAQYWGVRPPPGVSVVRYTSKQQKT